MPIVSISRDWGVNPSIVRIVATAPDTLASVAVPGYITAQRANIQLANTGDFEWNSTDEVLVNAGGTLNTETNEYVGGTNGFFEISADFSSLTASNSVSASFVGLTAHAGGGQTNGTPLNPGFNQFSTVVTAADSATLPASVLGETITVTNNGASSMTVYPALGDTINSLSVNTGLAVAVGATTVFYGVTASNWQSK
jgi:hypothetical protein